MLNEKHKIMLALEEEFCTTLRTAIASWEQRTGVYIKGVKYHKDSMHESLKVDTDLLLGKGIR